MVTTFDARFAERRRGHVGVASSSLGAVDATPLSVELDPFSTVDPQPRGTVEDEAPVDDETLIAAALDATARRLAPWPGLVAVPDPQPQRTSGGAVVRLHLQWRGVPVFEGVLTVRFARDGRPRDVSSHLDGALQTAQPLDLVPRVSASRATTLAALHVLAEVEHRLTARDSRTVIALPSPSRPTVLHKHGLRHPSTAQLVIFCLGNRRQLAWHVVLNDLLDTDTDGPNRLGHDAAVLVAANGPDAETLLYCRQLTDCALQALIFPHNPAETDAVLRPLPEPLASLPPLRAAHPLPEDFPPPWVDGRKTRGNNTLAAKGNRGAVRGRRVNDDLLFVQDDPLSSEQQVINAFYHCNRLHDLFYLLGFDEAAQNFQHRHLTTGNDSGDGSGDALEVRVFDSVLSGGAWMRSRQDGRSPEMVLGKLGTLPHDGDGAAPERPTALDADIIYHEFVHGVSNRLVGGRQHWDPLRHPQSHALGEGFSDYFALSLQNHERPAEDERTIFAPWTAGRPGGLRRHPYDDAYPAHFGDLGTPEHSDPHDAGEIWCAALMRWQRLLAVALEDRQRAHRLTWQLLVDCFKLMPVGPLAPTFLNARDALAMAIDQLPVGELLLDGERQRVHLAWRRAAAALGMGAAAFCPDASFDGVEPDFTPPQPIEPIDAPDAEGNVT